MNKLFTIITLKFEDPTFAKLGQFQDLIITIKNKREVSSVKGVKEKYLIKRRQNDLKNRCTNAHYMPIFEFLR